MGSVDARGGCACGANDWLVLSTAGTTCRYGDCAISNDGTGAVVKCAAIIGAPSTREVSFTDPKVERFHGAVYIHQRLGLALIIDRLPSAPDGWKYESWVVPKPAPHSLSNPSIQTKTVALCRLCQGPWSWPIWRQWQ